MKCTWELTLTGPIVTKNIAEPHVSTQYQKIPGVNLFPNYTINFVLTKKNTIVTIFVNTIPIHLTFNDAELKSFLNVC